MPNITATTQFPDIREIRSLLRTPWLAIEAQSGRIRHRSVATPGAWSASALLVRSAVDVLICAEGLEKSGCEGFHLRFRRADDDWCRSYLESSHPRFAPISHWPEGISLPSEFSQSGPTESEIGFGAPGGPEAGGQLLVPLLWCRFGTATTQIVLYADWEIPLNVGISQAPRTSAYVTNTLKAVSITKL